MKRVVLGLMLVGAIAACSRGNASTPGGAVEDFIRKSDSGDCPAIKEALAKDSRELMGDKIVQACKLGVAERDKQPNATADRLKSVSIIETKEEGERATVTFETVKNSDAKERSTMVLVREGGVWKIDPMASAQGQMGGRGAPTPPGAAPGAAPPAMPQMAPPAPTTAPPATPAPAPADEPAAEEATEEK